MNLIVLGGTANEPGDIIYGLQMLMTAEMEIYRNKEGDVNGLLFSSIDSIQSIMLVSVYSGVMELFEESTLMCSMGYSTVLNQCIRA